MDQDASGPTIESFLESGAGHSTLGLVYGRRRIGKSTLLQRIVLARGGFYWEATRTAPAVHLARLGEALGARLGVGRLSLEMWEEALAELVRLGQQGPLPVVLDGFGYLLEAYPSDSIVAAALGPARVVVEGIERRLDVMVAASDPGGDGSIRAPRSCHG